MTDMAEFFAQLRKRSSGVFGTSLTKSQVEGIEAIVQECARQGADLGQTAYILATAYGETGRKMQPRRENMSYTAKRIMQVWPKQFKSLEAARAYAGQPEKLANKVYGARLGNTQPGDGWRLRGVGIGQITGRSNLIKWGRKMGLPLVDEPELLMQLDVSVKALVIPMLEGWATGRALPEFVSGSRKNYTSARKVWNGTFEAKKYAGYARSFEAALTAAGYAPAEPQDDRQMLNMYIDYGEPAAKPSTGPSAGAVVVGSGIAAACAYAYATACHWPWLVNLLQLTCGD